MSEKCDPEKEKDLHAHLHPRVIKNEPAITIDNLQEEEEEENNLRKEEQYKQLFTKLKDEMELSTNKYMNLDTLYQNSNRLCEKMKLDLIKYENICSQYEIDKRIDDEKLKRLNDKLKRLNEKWIKKKRKKDKKRDRNRDRNRDRDANANATIDEIIGVEMENDNELYKYKVKELERKNEELKEKMRELMNEIKNLNKLIEELKCSKAIKKVLIVGNDKCIQTKMISKLSEKIRLEEKCIQTNVYQGVVNCGVQVVVFTKIRKERGIQSYQQKEEKKVTTFFDEETQTSEIRRIDKTIQTIKQKIIPEKREKVKKKKKKKINRIKKVKKKKKISRLLFSKNDGNNIDEKMKCFNQKKRRFGVLKSQIISELKSYDNPPVFISQVIKMLIRLIIGKHVIRSWSVCKSYLSFEFFVKISKFIPDENTNLYDLEIFINKKNEELANRSSFAGSVIYQFMKSVVDVVNNSRFKNIFNV